jgi:hypothetical protein
MAIEPRWPALPVSERDEAAIPWRQFAALVLRRHGVVLAALGLIAVQVAWKGVLLSHFFFWQDDFLYFDRALRSGFTWNYLMKVEGGHLDPGPFAVAWLLARVSLYNWALVSAVILVLLACCCLAALRLLTTLFGSRPAILIPLVSYLLCPLTVPAMTWWSSAIETLPLQLAMLMALNTHVRFVRSGRYRFAAYSAAWQLAGMLFFEKGVVVPFLLLAVTSAFLGQNGHWVGAVRRALRKHWKAWASYAVVLAGYGSVLAVQLTAPSAAPGKRGAPQDVLGFASGLVKNTFLPGAFGGPWRWFPNKVEAFSTPPAVLAWLSVFGALAVIAVSIWYRTVAWRAWAILAGWLVLADMVPVVIGRTVFVNGAFLSFLALDTHYVADAVPVLMICVALAFLPVNPGLSGHRPAAGAAAFGQPGMMLTGIVLGAVFFGSVWSVQGYVDVTTTQPGRAFIANARQALEQVPRGTPVVDQLASGDVMAAILLGRYGRDSAVIGSMAPGRVRWISQPRGTIAGLRVFAADGTLWPAAVVGTPSRPLPAGTGCWPPHQHSIVVPLRSAATVSNGPWTLRMSYVSSRDQQVTVGFGGQTASLALQKGLNTAYLPVRGSGNSVYIQTPGSARTLCVGTVEVGVLLQNLAGPSLPATPVPG